MRPDMKDVIINTGRHGGGWSRKYEEYRGKDLEKLDELPRYRGMKRRYSETKYFGDRLEPLIGLLHKNVGRPWNDVYSEICKHADTRNIRGYHLREHVWDYVATWNEYRAHRYYGYYDFYIDENGFLRFKPPQRWWRSRKRREPDANKCSIGGREFERIKGCWFETWVEREDYWCPLNECWRSETVTRQRQLSKQCLKELGLSNQPGWRWYRDHRSFEEDTGQEG